MTLGHEYIPCSFKFNIITFISCVYLSPVFPQITGLLRRQKNIMVNTQEEHFYLTNKNENIIHHRMLMSLYQGINSWINTEGQRLIGK